MGLASLVRSVAFYLPQFHPIPENNSWWGPGFTEWTNVARATRYFRGHEQPRIPADLGFYDLRLAETRAAQADLAAAYGFEAFCYYHYWFSGRELLQQPFQRVLETGQPRLSFCLCWANENWSRRWDGGSSEVLVEQQFSEEDHKKHIQHLLPAFDDSRYVRVEGRPIFLVYRAQDIPDLRAATAIWRAVARAEGIDDLMLLRVDAGDDRGDPRVLGFDAAVEFQPDFLLLGAIWEARRWKARAASKFRQWRGRPRIYSYQRYVDRVLSLPPTDYPRHPCVNVGWDNTPRRGARTLVLKDSTPGAFGQWVRARVDELVEREPDRERRLLFVNAWNEWAEGNYLEPDQTWGHGYLRAHRDGVTAEPLPAPHLTRS